MRYILKNKIMNTSISYVPNGDADRVIWLGNFKSKLPIYAPTLGISAAEVTSVTNDYNMYKYIMDVLEVYKQTTNNLVAYKDLLKHAYKQQHLGAIPVLPALAVAPTQVTEGVFDRISGLAKRMKGHPAYTDNAGKDMGIIAPEHVINVDALQPVLTVTLDAGRPHIKCVKGTADAIDLYVDRKDGNGFVLIGRLLKLNYIDVALLPPTISMQEWDYKAIYVIGNNPVGLMSAVVAILVKKM